MKRLYLIVFGLWLLAACAFGQNGPTPQVVIDTDQIVDGAVTALKTDGTLMLSDGSNASDAAAVRNNLGLGTMAVATATDYALVNGSATQNFAADNLAASTINSLPPLSVFYTDVATLTAESGTITSAVGSITWAIHSKILYINAHITITDAGTGIGALQITIPSGLSAKRYVSLAVADVGLGGSGIAFAAPAGTTIFVRKYEWSTLIANNAQLVVSGWIEVE